MANCVSWHWYGGGLRIDLHGEVEMNGDPGGRTPQSLAQDQWEELPLIKEGILGKV